MNNPVMVGFEIGTKAATQNLDYDASKKFIKTGIENWIEAGSELVRMGVATTTVADTGFEKSAYSNFSRHIAYCTRRHLVLAKGEYSVMALFSSLCEQNTDNYLYRAYLETYGNCKQHNKTQIKDQQELKQHNDMFEESYYEMLLKEEAALSSVFDSITPEKLEPYAVELVDFSVDSQHILQPLHNRQWVDKQLPVTPSRFNGSGIL